jgi:hypothetical protein
MALPSSVTVVLVAQPEPRSQPAIASKNTFFIASNIDPFAMIAPNGFLAHPNGSPNGSNFCKCFQTRKVYGLTGKIYPGDPSTNADSASFDLSRNRTSNFELRMTEAEELGWRARGTGRESHL